MGLWSRRQWCEQPAEGLHKRSHAPGLAALLILSVSLALYSFAATTLPSSTAAPALPPIATEDILIDGDSMVVLRDRVLEVSSVVVKDQGRLTIQGSTLLVSGAITISGEAVILVVDSTVEAKGPIVLTGSSVLYASNSSITSVTLSEQSSATFIDSSIQSLTVLEGSVAEIMDSTVAGFTTERCLFLASSVVYERDDETTVVLHPNPTGS